MKRVLIITYYWPPAGGSGVQRWLKFSKYLPLYGWQPVIYTPSNPDMNAVDASLAEDIPAEAEIIKKKITEPYSLFKKFVGREGGAEVVNPINNVGKKSPAMRLSLWIRANLFVPDPKILWIRPSVKFLKKYLREHPVDAIVSTGPPHSMHLIAMKLGRATGIRWIADFRDPWTGIFYFKHLPLSRFVRKKYFRLQKQVLLKADAVVGVTEKMKEEFEEIIALSSCGGSGDSTPVYTVENGFDEADFREDVPLDDFFTLTHTGLFSDEGNPIRLWEALNELCRFVPGFKDNLRLNLIGKTDNGVINSIIRSGLFPNMDAPGYRPHKEVNLRQKSARVLILPLRTEPEAAGILTGKYFEYLAAAHPIIAFGPHGSVLERSIEKTRAGKLFEWDEYAPLRDFILALYIDYLKSTGADNSVVERCWRVQEGLGGVGMPIPVPDKSEIERFSRRILAGEISKLF